jgi:hypothetical protein
MDIKKLIAGVAIAGTLTVGATSTAFATDGSSTTSGAKPAAVQFAKRHPALRKAVRRGALKVILTETHATAAQLRAGLKSGQSIADFATAHGSSGAAVSAALVTRADAAIVKATGAGKLTTAQAATLTAKVPAAVAKLVNRTWVHV